MKIFNRLGFIKYINFGSNIESPEEIVAVENNFALSTITNPNSKPFRITPTEPFDIEVLNTNERHFTNYLNITNFKPLKEISNLPKANLKNIRLEHSNKDDTDALRKMSSEIFFIVGTFH